MATFRRIVEKIWLATFIVVALVFIISYFRDDTDKLARVFDADLRALAWALVAQIAYFLTTVVTWQKALLYATGKTIALRESLSQILMVNFGKYIPGKIWGMAARGKRLVEAGYGVEEIARTSYLEQALLLLTGFALALVAAAITFGNTIYWLGFLLALVAIMLFRHGDTILQKLAQFIPRAGSLLRYFQVRIGTFEVLKLAAGYTFQWLFLAGAFTFVCTSIISVEITPANIAIFVLSLTAGFLAGFLALFAPGGVGVREGVGAALLTSVVSLEEAVLLMLLFRVWVVAAELIAGAIVLGSAGERGIKTGAGVDR